jgi:hypothetical protein
MHTRQEIVNPIRFWTLVLSIMLENRSLIPYKSVRVLLELDLYIVQYMVGFVVISSQHSIEMAHVPSCPKHVQSDISHRRVRGTSDAS